MIRLGCTARHSFAFPFEQKTVEAVFITYCQKDDVVLEKTLEDCTFEKDSISVSLSQEETLLFEKNCFTKIQIRVRLSDGTTTKSNIVHIFSDDLLKGGRI